MMTIFLKAGSELRLKLKPDVDYYTRRVETEGGKTLREILRQIGLDPAFVAFAYSEGKLRSLDSIPQDGQNITLQPPVSGG
jgi:sulfur carrier protein ThiS